MDRYEEALEKARAEYEKAREQGYTWLMNLLEGMFPDLKESEDERVRKFLVKHISEWIGCIEHDLKLSSKDVESEEELAMFKAGLAYLEKQEEQKFTEKQDYSDLTDLERAIHRGFLVVGVENVPVTIIKETAQDCLAQMKPAEWSDEDEKHIEALFLASDRCMGKWHCCNEQCEISEHLDWLKSLRPQPHTVSIKNATKFGNLEYERGVKDGIQYSENHRWKPSREQMGTLKQWIQDHELDGDSRYVYPIFYSLFADLQKLL